MLPLESDLEGDYCTWLVEEFPKKALALKLVLFVGRGFPDRTVLCEGKVFFIEFKRPTEHSSKRRQARQSQVRWHKILKRLGFSVYVCQDLEDAIAKTYLETA